MYQRPAEHHVPAEEHLAPGVQQTAALGQKCIAEFIGTAFLVFIGCGTLTASSYLAGGKVVFASGDLLAVATAFGVAIAIMMYALSRISGCHINPAVSIALACVRRISWSEAGAYIVAQLFGGILGALLVAVTFGARSAATFGYGATDYNPVFVNYFGAIVVEAIGTFFLLFVIMATVIDRRVPAGWSGLAVGLTITLGMLAVAVVTGGNFNPARAFGPTIVQMLFGGSYPFGHMFVYFIGPIIGGVLGAFAYEYLAGLHAMKETQYRGVESGSGD